MIALTIVVPVYNEQQVLASFFERLKQERPAVKEILNSKSQRPAGSAMEILFINDGSTDGTRGILESMIREDRDSRLINFSRNFGHQAAVTAGVRLARGAAVVVMDADLQDPPEVIKEMVKKWKDGCDVVFAVRRKRQENWLKRCAYSSYYRLKASLSDYPVHKDAGDFGLMDRRVVDVINTLPEKDRYLRGLRSWVGFQQADVSFERPGRREGRSKYSVAGLFKLAFQGILSTSVKPLFLSGLFCAFSLVLVFALAAYAVFSKVFVARPMPPGWTSLMVTIAVLGGLQLVAIWLLSLYISRIYTETLGRPTYIVESDSLSGEIERGS